MQQFDSFAQMQRDAERRVMEMQKRAMAAVEGSDPPPIIIPEPSRDGCDLTGRKSHEYHDVDEYNDDYNANEPHQAHQESATYGEPPGISNESEKNAALSGGLLPGLNLSGEDSERALLIAILLLIREQADRNLIFLLLYLML